MGLDWQTQCAPTWERSWLRGLERLSEPDLFTNKMPEVERTVRARPLDQCTFGIGSEYILRVNGSQINVFDGLTQIGFVADVPETVLQAIRDSNCGVALGVVRHVHEYTRSADLACNECSEIQMKEPSERNRRNDPTLWYDGAQVLKMGCSRCSDLRTCGGLRIKAAVFDCSHFCRCSPDRRADCELACPLNPRNLVARSREVGGWELNVSSAPAVPIPDLPSLIPLIKDRACGYNGHPAGVVGLRLDRLLAAFEQSTTATAMRREVERRFGLSPDTGILVSSVGYDDPLERYWGLRSRGIVAFLAALQPHLITVPNFSLFTDLPRHEDLYNMKRIAKAWGELAAARIPTALHVNARTDRDWERWGEFLQRHPEIGAVAFEFGTGAKNSRRGRWHCEKLARLSVSLERPLTLVLRGGSQFLEELNTAFSRLCFVSMKPYVCTVQRQKMSCSGDGTLTWAPCRLRRNQLGELFSHNVRTMTKMVRLKRGGPQSRLASEAQFQTTAAS